MLEIADPLARLRRVDALLRRELDVSTVQAEIQSQAKEEMSRSQREHFLREQLRAIQGELGEARPARSRRSPSTARSSRRRACPRRRTRRRTRQLRRLERMHPDGPEAQVVRTYLEWMAELPWSRDVARPARPRSARARSSTRTTRT